MVKPDRPPDTDPKTKTRSPNTKHDRHTKTNQPTKKAEQPTKKTNPPTKKTDPPTKTDRTKKTEQPAKTDRRKKTDQPAKTDRTKRTDQRTKSDRPKKTEKSDQPSKKDRHSKKDRPHKSDKQRDTDSRITNTSQYDAEGFNVRGIYSEKKKKMILIAILAFCCLLLVAIILAVKLSSLSSSSSSSAPPQHHGWYCQDSAKRTTDKKLSSIMEKLSASKARPVANSSLQYEGKLHRFACVNNSLWIANGSKGAVSVVNLELKDHEFGLIKITPNSDILGQSLLQINSSEVVMASPNGLFVLNMTGHIQYNVSEGFFTDVAMNSNIMVAIEIRSASGGKQAYAHKLLYKQNKLQIEANKTDSTYVVKHLFITVLLSNDNRLFIAGINGSVLKMYQADSFFNSKVISQNHDHSLVSYSDTSGSILICNNRSGNFEVINTANNKMDSKTYELDGIIKPIDFLIIKDYVYILSQSTENGKAVYIAMYRLP